MSHPNFSDAALVLTGHGTSLDPDSATPVLEHAAELRRRNVFAEVREAFWKQEPQVTNVLGAVSHLRVFIVPFFLSEGYFCERVIPGALGFQMTEAADVSGSALGHRILKRDCRRLYYCKPVGTHALITELVTERARQTLAQFPFPRPQAPNSTTLFLASHGTERDENSRQSAERQVQLIREQHLFSRVEAIYLEEEPRINRFAELTTDRNVVVVPFFVSEGLHVKNDIPVLLGMPKRVVQDRVGHGQLPWRNPTETSGKLVWYTHAVGTHPRMADIILERAAEATQWV